MDGDEDDPRRPLLGPRNNPGWWDSASISAKRFCSVSSWRQRVPITIWLPKYCWSHFFSDMIAGITVGLTSIPQGIAYAIIAGLPPQIGLYSSLFPGIVYATFGSCKVVTVGPTAILAALLAKYVAVSVDFAFLAAFLSGAVILVLGVLQLGFLLDFISKPVISGFTTAAGLQIAAAQLKSLFRISGKSGSTFIDAVINFVKNIKTVKLWDPVLGFATIIALVILKNSSISPISPIRTSRGCITSFWEYIVRARNALVVFAGALLSFCFYLKNIEPFALTGKIEGGLPKFGPPPFSTKVGNTTYSFDQMLEVFGVESLVMPLVAILESIAIAKAFADNSKVDATQEMIAVGMCNLLASFCQCMPATGSFTRTALNHASGVATPAGSLFKATLVLLAVTLMTRAFYFIPRATLAAVIIVAMMYIIDFAIIRKLWRNSKIELLVFLLTVIVGLSAGLEYGILAGVSADAARVLFRSARPKLIVDRVKIGNQDCIIVTLVGDLSYPCAEYLMEELSVAKYVSTCYVLDGKHIHSVDVGVAEILVSVIEDIEKRDRKVLLWNFSPGVQELIGDLRPRLSGMFVSGSTLDRHVLSLNEITAVIEN